MPPVRPSAATVRAWYQGGRQRVCQQPEPMSDGTTRALLGSDGLWRCRGAPHCGTEPPGRRVFSRAASVRIKPIIGPSALRRPSLIAALTAPATPPTEHPQPRHRQQSVASHASEGAPPARARCRLAACPPALRGTERRACVATWMGLTMPARLRGYEFSDAPASQSARASAAACQSGEHGTAEAGRRRRRQGDREWKEMNTR